MRAQHNRSCNWIYPQNAWSTHSNLQQIIRKISIYQNECIFSIVLSVFVSRSVVIKPKHLIHISWRWRGSRRRQRQEPTLNEVPRHVAKHKSNQIKSKTAHFDGCLCGKMILFAICRRYISIRFLSSQKLVADAILFANKRDGACERWQQKSTTFKRRTEYIILHCVLYNFGKMFGHVDIQTDGSQYRVTIRNHRNWWNPMTKKNLFSLSLSPSLALCLFMFFFFQFHSILYYLPAQFTTN